MARPRKSKGTKQLLLEEGVSAFLQNGFHGTGIKQVLDRVKVPKGSFYNYFSSKEDFGAQAVQHYANCLGQKLSAARGEHDDALRALHSFLEDQMAGFKAANFTGGCLVANLGGELEGSEVCRKALVKALDGWRSGVRDALSAAQDQGRVRKDITAEELADMFVDSWEGAVIRMKIHKDLSPLKDCIRRHLDQFFQPVP